MSQVDVVFMPYNYLLDFQIQRTFEINLKDSIIIFDEGHNVEKNAEEGASFSLSSIDLLNCTIELNQILAIKSDKDSNKFQHIKLSEILFFKFLVQKFFKILQAKAKNIKSKPDPFTQIKRQTEEGKIVINGIFRNILKVTR